MVPSRRAVVGRVVLAEFAGVQALWKVGNLVDHSVWLNARHERTQPSGVEDVAQDRLGAEGAEHIELLLRPSYRSYLMACFDQLRNEPPADGAGSAR
jgi:hypothetical protein